MASVEVIRHRGEKNDEFYWERVNRNLGWLGQTEAEARKRQTMLRDSVVGIAGTGGIGGSTALRLIRMGVGTIKLADSDTFDVSNIQRQVGAELAQLGRNKAAVIGEMGIAISGDVDIDVFPQGITDDTAEQFVEGCDIILDQIDIYAVDAHYALHEAFRRSSRCKSIITVLTIGHAAYVTKYTHNSMQIEDVYGLPKPEGAELSTDELRQLIERIVPERPDYPTWDAIDRWWVDDRTVCIWAGTPPLCEGVLAERTALELMDFPNVAPLPEQPGYAILDTKSWTAKTVHGQWWTAAQG